MTGLRMSHSYAAAATWSAVKPIATAPLTHESHTIWESTAFLKPDRPDLVIVEIPEVYNRQSPRRTPPPLRRRVSHRYPTWQLNWPKPSFMTHTHPGPQYRTTEDSRAVCERHLIPLASAQQQASIKFRTSTRRQESDKRQSSAGALRTW